jgi:hypothetical protein
MKNSLGMLSIKEKIVRSKFRLVSKYICFHWVFLIVYYGKNCYYTSCRKSLLPIMLIEIINFILIKRSSS